MPIILLICWHTHKLLQTEDIDTENSKHAAMIVILRLLVVLINSHTMMLLPSGTYIAEGM